MYIKGGLCRKKIGGLFGISVDRVTIALGECVVIRWNLLEMLSTENTLYEFNVNIICDYAFYSLR